MWSSSSTMSSSPASRSCSSISVTSSVASSFTSRCWHDSERPTGGRYRRWMSSTQAPDRNLAMEIVRVTEAASLAAARWMGRGDKNGADGAAVDAMRHMLQSVSMKGVVIIGEGEKDEAPMLYNGEEV